MDAFAAAVSARAHVKVSAVYEPTDRAGVEKLQSAGIALVSLPFFLAHEKELGLHPRLVAIQKGRPALDHWVIVAAKGVKALDGYTIIGSTAGDRRFVSGVVLGRALPETTKLQASGSVLSALRRAANGDKVAVLLDGSQEASLATLPFGAKLDVIARSPEVPAGLVATIDARMPDAEWAPIQKALLAIGSDKSAATLLDGMRLAGFAQLDPKSLEVARKAYGAAP